MITLTPKAAAKVNKIRSEQGAEGKLLRLFATEGGCCGMEYGMAFDDREAGDALVETEGITVVINPESLAYLKGLEIDFDKGPEGEGFSFVNPNAEPGCGCGCSSD